MCVSASQAAHDRGSFCSEADLAAFAAYQASKGHGAAPAPVPGRPPVGENDPCGTCGRTPALHDALSRADQTGPDARRATCKAKEGRAEGQEVAAAPAPDDDEMSAAPAPDDVEAPAAPAPDVGGASGAVVAWAERRRRPHGNCAPRASW